MGFGHLLFAARPALPDRPVTRSVFRVDVAPYGWVIWSELVWHFGGDVGGTRVLLSPDELSAVPSPTTECCARVLFGVTSLDGREGYYAYTLDGEGATWSDLSAVSRPAAIKFFAVDSARQIRPGAWTYGEDVALPPYGKAKAYLPAPRLETQDAALWRAYLDTLD